MNHGDVLVIGGTSDARAICQQLDAADVRYTLSVATPTGERLAGDIRGQIRCGRMEWQQMAEWLRAQRTRWVIDASHPYAEVVSHFSCFLRPADLTTPTGVSALLLAASSAKARARCPSRPRLRGL